MQWKKLRHLLDLSAVHIPYYKNLFEANNIKTNEIKTYDDFCKIPLLEKEVVRGNSKQLINPQFDGKFYKTKTSGSTGLALELLISRDMESWVLAGQWRARHWFGVDIGERALYIWGRPLESPTAERIGKIKARVNNIMLISGFELSDELLNNHWKRIQRFRPKYIYGYASSVFKLADYVKRSGQKPHFPSKAIFTTSETLLDYQRSLIETVFECPVAEEYGCAEVGAFAFECPNNNLHLFPENIFIEFLRDEKPVRAGEVGEIVVTTLNNYCMPLIRYRIGDMGSTHENQCPCQRGLPLMDLKVAKITDMIITTKGEVFSSELFDYINLELVKKQIKGIRQFRVTQEEEDSFQIEIVKDEPFSDESIEFFKKKMLDFFGKNIRITIVFVNEIQREKSGKIRYFVSVLNKH